MYVAGPSGIVAPPPGVRVALSTSSLYPESTAAGFELAARLGYDGIELMVWGDPVSQDVDAVRRLSDHYRIPVLAVHTPCLLLTQRVWGTDPWAKLDRSCEAAAAFGAGIVVVHPPFRWQRDYARDFVEGVRERSAAGPARIAVENMFPLRAGGREVIPYAPGWSPLEQDYADVTLDLSHTATSGSDALDMAAQLGDRLAHVHLADGLGSSRDEHLVPGRGTQPCAELLETLAGARWEGLVVVEVSTRRAPTRADREADLAESLAFARRHLAAGARPGRAGEPELEPAG